MPNAISFRFQRWSKKKLKTFRDFPLVLNGRKELNRPSSSPEIKKKSPIEAQLSAIPSKPIPKSSIAVHSKTGKTRRSVIRINSDQKPDVVEEEIDYGNKGFNQEQLQLLWEKYANNTKQISGGLSGSLIANCQPQLLEDRTTVHLVFRNETNRKGFLRLSEDLLTHLKSELQNNNILFSMEVNKSKAKKVLYSNRDKFDHFSEKYPKLKDWENKLGLELN